MKKYRIECPEKDMVFVFEMEQEVNEEKLNKYVEEFSDTIESINKSYDSSKDEG